jgi:hypothetical protein
VLLYSSQVSCGRSKVARSPSNALLVSTLFSRLSLSPDSSTSSQNNQNGAPTLNRGSSVSPLLSSSPPSVERVLISVLTSLSSPLNDDSSMYNSVEDPSTVEPILQVLSVKKVNQSGQGADRYRQVTPLPLASGGLEEGEEGFENGMREPEHSRNAYEAERRRSALSSGRRNRCRGFSSATRCFLHAQG